MIFGGGGNPTAALRSNAGLQVLKSIEPLTLVPRENFQCINLVG
jgi:hypothetical protein